MSDGKSGFRKHIRAAREWLGRAESSLDKQDDIRGDLNLMLARAELQRAQETKRLTTREIWFRRFVPFLAAGTMVAGCFVFLQAERPLTKVVQPQAAIVSVPVQEADPTIVKEDGPRYSRATAAETAAVAVDSGNTSLPVAVQPRARGPESEQVTETGPDTAVLQKAVIPHEAVLPQEQLKTGVPPENMQKLMQAAGQTLRAH